VQIHSVPRVFSHTGVAFRTDTDISAKKGLGRERELQAWVPSNDVHPVSLGDDETFGTNGGSWDQFTVNEQLFGVKASFDEEVYTTKLDRSAPDFKERERQAQRIAAEIMGVCTMLFVFLALLTLGRPRPTILTSLKSVDRRLTTVVQTKKTSTVPSFGEPTPTFPPVLGRLLLPPTARLLRSRKCLSTALMVTLFRPRLHLRRLPLQPRCGSSACT